LAARQPRPPRSRRPGICLGGRPSFAAIASCRSGKPLAAPTSAPAHQSVTCCYWCWSSPTACRLVQYLSRTLPGVDDEALSLCALAECDRVPANWDLPFASCRPSIVVLGVPLLLFLSGFLFWSQGRASCDAATRPWPTSLGRGGGGAIRLVRCCSICLLLCWLAGSAANHPAVALLLSLLAGQGSAAGVRLFIRAADHTGYC